MAKLIGLVVVVVVIIVIISGQGAPGGSCEGIVNVIGHSTECVYRAVVKGGGLIVDGDEGVFTLIGLVVLVSALGLFGSISKRYLTLSDVVVSGQNGINRKGNRYLR